MAKNHPNPLSDDQIATITEGMCDNPFATHAATLEGQPEATPPVPEGADIAAADAPELTDPTDATDPVAPAEPASDAATLRQLIASVDAANHDGGRLTLLQDLAVNHGLEPLDMDQPQITLAGVTGGRASTLSVALTNWSNAARRCLIAMGAV